MGQLRVHSLAKLLASSPGEQDAVANDYAKAKMNKLVNKAHKGDDVFEQCRLSSELFGKQAVLARRFMAPALSAHVRDQSPLGAAKASEAFNEVLDCIISFKQARTNREHVEVYQRLLNSLLSNPEPVVKTALITTLNQMHEGLAKEDLRDVFSKPFAAAVCLRFKGLPTDRPHRQEVRAFLDSHFPEELYAVAHTLKHELGVHQRKATTELVVAVRVANALSMV